MNTGLSAFHDRAKTDDSGLPEKKPRDCPEWAKQLGREVKKRLELRSGLKGLPPVTAIRLRGLVAGSFGTEQATLAKIYRLNSQSTMMCWMLVPRLPVFGRGVVMLVSEADLLSDTFCQ